MSSQGWVCVHRQLLDNPIFKNDKLFRVFMYCLLKASHSKHDQLVGDSIVTVNSGQFVTGRKAISSSTGLTEQNVRTALVKLEKLSILTIKPTNKYSIISITNWDKYQQSNQQVTSKQPASNQQVTTNNNGNNGNNEDKSIVEAKPQRSKFKFNDDQYRFAEEMFKRISNIAPNIKKPNLESWANTIRLLNENDKVNLNVAWKVFCWANSDSFWSTNILSASKFREQYAQLSAKMNNNPLQAQQQEARRPSRKEIKL